MVQYVLSGTTGTGQKENSEQAVKLHHNSYSKTGLLRFQWDCHNLILEGKESALWFIISLRFHLWV